MQNISTLANWEINFINANRATLNFFYDKKKRLANLRISIQNNKDFYGNGKWRSQTAQGGRFIRLKYIDANKQNSYRWNDPKFNIKWPVKNPILSKRDKNSKLL